MLVTGATGYVGGRLVPVLLAQDFEVRCLARTVAKLEAAPWRGAAEVVQGDIGGELSSAMTGVDVAVYLVHSIGQGQGWSDREHSDAANFAEAAAQAGVRRIVYLGGLGRDDDALSEHLESRHEVGRVLASTGVEVVEIRAGVIIGAGSASFEMLRYLVEVLPVMVTPKWVDTRCQPIAIADVVDVLVSAIGSGAGIGGVYEAGGTDVVTYSEMMETYAEVAGLPHRWLIRVPLLTPRLSSHWVGLVTPVPVPLARELVESLVNEVVVQQIGDGGFLGPAHGAPRSDQSSVGGDAEGNVATSFSDADLVVLRPTPTDPDWSGGTSSPTTDHCGAGRAGRGLRHVATDRCRRGWYSGKWLWRIRGLLDDLRAAPDCGVGAGRR